MEEIILIGSQFLVLLIVIYALLLILGSPFGGPEKFANPYAKWVWKQVRGLLIGAIKLPFQLLSQLVFKKKKKKKKKKKWQ